MPCRRRCGQSAEFPGREISSCHFNFSCSRWRIALSRERDARSERAPSRLVAMRLGCAASPGHRLRERAQTRAKTSLNSLASSLRERWKRWGVGGTMRPVRVMGSWAVGLLQVREIAFRPGLSGQGPLRWNPHPIPSLRSRRAASGSSLDRATAAGNLDAPQTLVPLRLMPTPWRVALRAAATGGTACCAGLQIHS